MKIIITYSIIIAITLLSACRKSDNPKIPDLIRIPIPLITVDISGDVTISGDDPASFKGKFIVDNYFKDDTKPEKLDVVIIKNGDHSKVVHFKDGITTFPTSLEITGTQLIALFGEPIVLGDQFTIGTNVTAPGGKMYEAFPDVKDGNGNYFSPYGAGINTQASASTEINFTCVCAFNINDFVGAATVTDPFFWEGSYDVTVTLEGTNLVKISPVNTMAQESFLIKLDPKFFTATVDKQVIDPDVSSWIGPYTNLAVAGKGSVDACQRSLNLNLNWTVDQGSFGSGAFKIAFH